MLKLGLFEIGTSPHHENDLGIIENTIEFAKLADESGYSRFWLGEHHESQIAWRSPEILMGILAGSTDTIKIGAAGILLALHSPLRVAQNFKMLASLFSNRIDLGIARGKTLPSVARELLNGLDYEEMLKDHIPRIRELLKFINNSYIYFNDNQAPGFVNVPVKGDLPDVWMLGSSGKTIDFVIKEQLNFAWSLIHLTGISYDDVKERFHTFIKTYEDTNQQKPVTNITISVICAEKKQERDAISNQHEKNFAVNIIGDVNSCYEQIHAIKEDFKTDEILLQIYSPNAKAKLAVIEQFSEKFQLRTSLLNKNL